MSSNGSIKTQPITETGWSSIAPDSPNSALSELFLCYSSVANSSTMSFPFHISEHVIDTQYVRDSPRATASQNAMLKLCVKKYTPIDNTQPQPGDFTIVATHGTSLLKVSYHTLPICTILRTA
jgi:hypothetical protein